ncbi:MAG TPA: VOC family protein [Bryobacteraceae bacterium]|jgi:predicted enzyme related to lactoylglutathione lyase|nr:VOC family protein [Bryobacteraceae bacterium]
MQRVTLVKVFVNDQEAARRFYVEQLGFQMAEDRQLGDYRWLLVKASDNTEFSINLDLARSDEEKALVGRQAAAQPLFSISTDNCRRDYDQMKQRGVKFESEPKSMPYGTGVMLQDLYGNKIYLNEDPA